MYANVNVILIVIVFLMSFIREVVNKNGLCDFRPQSSEAFGMQRFTDPAVFLTFLKKGGVNPMLIKNTDFVKAFSHKIDV